jgi:hypothetical protein
MTEDSTEKSKTPYERAQSFATTHWSMIRAAGGEDTAAREAMAALCRSYWFPLYAFVRRKGRSPQDAEDLTQEFFAQLLEHHWVAQADRSKGRFRSFLLTAFSHFLATNGTKPLPRSAADIVGKCPCRWKRPKAGSDGNRPARAPRNSSSSGNGP